MKIEQSAGECRIEVYTDGSPLWPELSIVQINGKPLTAKLSVAHLYDLRYCINRVLEQLPNRN